MAECKSCGGPVTTRVNLCPSCGLNPSVQTITSIQEQFSAGEKSGSKKARRRKMAKKQSMEIEDKVCMSCGTVVTTRVNLCPSCGLNLSVETITSVLDSSKRMK